MDEVEEAESLPVKMEEAEENEQEEEENAAADADNTASATAGTEFAEHEQQQQQEQQIPQNMVVVVLPPPPRAAELVATEEFLQDPSKQKLYWDRSHYENPAAQMKALANSAWLYIGNLSFTTRTRQVQAHFSQVGPVKSVIMGLDRLRKTPCGFCFVEYYHRSDALQAVTNLSATKLNGRVIRVELDAGFQPGRQYGRGVSGGQVRDDRNKKQSRSREDESRSSRKRGRSPPGSAEQQQRQQEDGAELPQQQEGGDDGNERDGDRGDQYGFGGDEGATGGNEAEDDDIAEHAAKRRRL